MSSEMNWPPVLASDLPRLNPIDYEIRRLSESEILSWFDLLDAVWLHDGNPAKPHAKLVSGKCSNGYFDCPRVLKYPNLNEILANQLALKIFEAAIIQPDWVIGSAYSAITFSYEVARLFRAIHGFTEKDQKDSGGKRMVLQRQTIPAGSNVLQIEELITTSHTMYEVRRAVEEGNKEPVEFYSFVGTLIHRPPKLPWDYGDIRVFALIEKEVWAIEPEKCPLCKEGSMPLRPKAHWEELTAQV